MADVAVPGIATATPTGADTVLGVQGGAVKRFSVSSLSLAADSPHTSASSSANYASTRNHATSSYILLGVDPVDNVVFVRDATNGVLRQTADLGATFSNSKTWPTNVAWDGAKGMLRFKNKLYLCAKDTSDNIYKVFSCDPASGNTAFSWSAALHAMTDANSTGFPGCFSCDDSYMYLSEYGDPGAGPCAWRSADGETWDVCYPADASLRHIHNITPDPYHAGHVYMTCGDGTAKTIQRSTDYGATWEVVVASSRWQAVNISFSERYVFFAGDSQRGMVWFMDRDELVPRWYSPSMLANIAVPKPSALTDQFYFNAYYGVVDPDTGVFYASANDSSAGGTVAGLFAVYGPGEPAVLVEKLSAIQVPIQIFGGYLWFGYLRRELA